MEFDDLAFKPAASNRWADLEALFFERGIQIGYGRAHWRIAAFEALRSLRWENNGQAAID
jgi:hypothetical protein